MLIEVKEEDWRNFLQIRNKYPNPFVPSEFIPQSLCCPIVFALKRTFGVEFCQVQYHRIEVGRFPDNIIFEVKTPNNVFLWLKKFDSNSGNFSPFLFELNLPSDTPIS